MKKLTIIAILLLALTSCSYKFQLRHVEMIKTAEAIYCTPDRYNVIELDMGYTYTSSIEDGVFNLCIDDETIYLYPDSDFLCYRVGSTSIVELHCSEENYKKLKKFAK